MPLWPFKKICISLQENPGCPSWMGKHPQGGGETAGWLDSVTSPKCGLPCFCEVLYVSVCAWTNTECSFSLLSFCCSTSTTTTLTAVHIPKKHRWGGNIRHGRATKPYRSFSQKKITYKNILIATAQKIGHLSPVVSNKNQSQHLLQILWNDPTPSTGSYSNEHTVISTALATNAHKVEGHRRYEALWESRECLTASYSKQPGNASGHGLHQALQKKTCIASMKAPRPTLD